MLRTFLNMFSFQKFIKTFLFHILEYTYSIWYIYYIRNNRPQGVDLMNLIVVQNYHLFTQPKFRGSFFMQKYYLTNENMNVSNARINIPKAIRSLKSKCCPVF